MSLSDTHILGINAYHGDSSACLVRNGQLVAAAEEERFRRTKHWAGFPSEAIRYCLEAGDVALSEVGHVAINQDSRANFGRKLVYMLHRRPEMSLVMDRLRNKQRRLSVGEALEASLGKKFHGEVHAVGHHLAHLCSAYLVSPFQRAVTLSVDGFGDFASAAWGLGEGGGVSVEGQVYFPHSLGIFYQALTQYLGFPHYGDEYKVMGLAPYGEPRYLQQMRQIVRLKETGSYELDLTYFRHARERIPDEWNNGSPTVGTLFAPALEQLLGPARRPEEPLDARHKDIARSVQVMYEEAFFHLLNCLHARYRTDALALAGGCAMNSVANGKVYARTPFKRLYVQSAAGDAGGAIGAAFSVWSKMQPSRARFSMEHAYWGPEFADSDFERAIQDRAQELAAAGCEVARGDEDSVIALAASAIAEGRVVGWFQGRMEWGPRALGNRSILGDPRRADMKDILNHKIKRRESFRPFAPSVLREAVREWFETDDDVPFMMQVYQVRPERRAAVPAITHVDGSGRLQTVTAATNPMYHRLISQLEKKTGVPMVLNTSFNENEPVVCRPAEALDCFLRTRMDLLVLGRWLVRRP